MRVKMYMRPEELGRYRNKRAAYASTFRDNDSCFEVYVNQEQIDLERKDGMPSNNFFIDQIGPVKEDTP